MMVMMSEGGESKHDTNINFLLEEFGIMVNSGPFSLQFSVSKFRANAASSMCLSSRVTQPSFAAISHTKLALVAVDY